MKRSGIKESFQEEEFTTKYTNDTKKKPEDRARTGLGSPELRFFRSGLLFSCRSCFSWSHLFVNVEAGASAIHAKPAAVLLRGPAARRGDCLRNCSCVWVVQPLFGVADRSTSVSCKNAA